jgi:hypothetical protein
MGVILVIHRMVHILGRLRPLLAVAEGVIDTRNAAKVDGEVTRGADDAPVVVTGHEDLAATDLVAGNLQLGLATVGRDDLLLAQRRGHGAKAEPAESLGDQHASRCCCVGGKPSTASGSSQPCALGTRAIGRGWWKQEMEGTWHGHHLVMLD